MAASTPAKIKIDSTLTSLNGLISSGNGRDEIDLSNSTGDNLVFTGNGADLFKGGDGDDIAYGGNGVDRLEGGDGNDTLYGENGVDRLEGGDGDDTLHGGNGADELKGGDGNDALYGEAANDTLYGGEDDGTFSVTVDTPPTFTFALTAGDVLTGGAGRDTFKYEVDDLLLGETDGVDRITDFVLGQDKLVLEGVTLAQLNSATDGTNLYIGFDDGLGGWVADSVVVIDGLTDINQMISQGSLSILA
jgi:Ca2+-binding RTX toxin-like protein